MDESVEAGGDDEQAVRSILGRLHVQDHEYEFEMI